MFMPNILRIGLRGILILIGLFLVACLIWTYRMGYSFFLTGGQTALIEPYDLNNDGHLESYILENHSLKIMQNELVIWKSPADWRVTSFVIGDANHDKQADLIMVVWKKGSFGNDMPFWLQLNDQHIHCHLFLFDLAGDQAKPLWMSSALDQPIISLQIQDMNEDGKNELLIQEGSYSFLSYFLNSDASEPTLWQWKSWGFYRLDATEDDSGSSP